MQPLQYSALEPVRCPRPVDRLDHLEGRVRGATVFDLGALDETAYLAKQTSTSWLHARLCGSASSVVGIDSSLLVPDEGLTTAPNGKIIRANIFDLQGTVDRYGRPDVIVAGEIIEHLPDTGALLQSLKQIPPLAGARLLVSTPNACCWHNFLIGLAGRESMHKDHLQVYSYKVLATLFDRHGYEVETITPYHARFPEMIEARQGLASIGARLFEKTVNVLETLAPMLSGGWIVETRI